MSRSPSPSTLSASAFVPAVGWAMAEATGLASPAGCERGRPCRAPLTDMAPQELRLLSDQGNLSMLEEDYYQSRARSDLLPHLDIRCDLLSLLCALRRLADTWVGSDKTRKPELLRPFQPLLPRPRPQWQSPTAPAATPPSPFPTAGKARPLPSAPQPLQQTIRAISPPRPPPAATATPTKSNSGWQRQRRRRWMTRGQHPGTHFLQRWRQLRRRRWWRRQRRPPPRPCSRPSVRRLLRPGWRASDSTRRSPPLKLISRLSRAASYIGQCRGARIGAQLCCGMPAVGRAPRARTLLSPPPRAAPAQPAARRPPLLPLLPPCLLRQIFAASGESAGVGRRAGSSPCGRACKRAERWVAGSAMHTLRSVARRRCPQARPSHRRLSGRPTGPAFGAAEAGARLPAATYHDRRFFRD